MLGTAAQTYHNDYRLGSQAGRKRGGGQPRQTLEPTPADLRSETPPLPPPCDPPGDNGDPGAASGVGETGTVPVAEELTTEHLLTHKPKSDINVWHAEQRK